jgi:hypothetical protein
MTQLDLFPPSVNQPTSIEAAEQIGSSAAALRAKVYHFIAERGDHGATDDECQLGLKLQGSTQRPRRIELVARGLIVDSGMTRLTTSGRKAIVWRITEQA